MQNKEVQGLMLQESRLRLEGLGFKAKTKSASASLYRLQISSECDAIVRISFTSPPKETSYCSYTIGSRLTKVERLVDYATRNVSSFLQYRNEYMSTLARDIGYVSPENRYLMFNAERPEQVSSLVDYASKLIADYGLPYVRSHSTISQVVAYLSRNKDFGFSSPTQPVLVALNGDCDTAVRLIKRDFLQSNHFERDKLAAIGIELMKFVEKVRELGPDAILMSSEIL